MSSYATKQDLIDRFGEQELIERTDRVHIPPSTVDDAVVDQALGDATSEIDGYIAARYTLPLASVPRRLVKVTCDLARYYLLGNAADDTARAAYEDGVKWLVNVSKGVVQLDKPEGGDAPAPAGGPQVSSVPHTFDPDTMRDF